MPHSDMFDWENMLHQLHSAQLLWQQNQVSRYTYQYSTTCYCLPCWKAPKFVFVEDGIVENVEFDDSINLAADCGGCDLEFPLIDHYHSIDWFYDEAIKFATEGKNADCHEHTDGTDGSDHDSEYCGASMTFTFDNNVHYPTKIEMKYGPSVADVDRTYHFGCLQVYEMNGNIDDSNYQGQCPNYDGCTTAPCDVDFWPCKDHQKVCCHGQEFDTPCDAKCDGFNVANKCQTGECRHRKLCKCTRELMPMCCKGKRYLNKCLAKCHGMDIKECSPHHVGQGPCDDPNGALLESDSHEAETATWWERHIWRLVFGAGILVVMAIMLNLAMRYCKRSRRLHREAQRMNAYRVSEGDAEVAESVTVADLDEYNTMSSM